jgi:hypothetical protein
VLRWTQTENILAKATALPLAMSRTGLNRCFCDDCQFGLSFCAETFGSGACLIILNGLVCD